MHSRDRREFGRRKMRIRNKWEVVLVLTVIAAGIVITTVAAIKAKERRQMQVESKSAPNSNKSTVSHVREVLVTHSSDTSTKNLNKKKGFPLNNSVKRQKVVDSPPDYDVEYDLVKSGADEYTALASESIDSIPRNKLRIAHDGLPGFPPPMGISNDFNSNVELSADAAGFVLESADQTSGEESVPDVEYRDIISKIKSNSESNQNVRQSVNKVKPSIKLTNNYNNHKTVDIFNNNNQRTSVSDNNNNHDYSAAKSEPKRIPVFADPPKDISEANFKLMANKPPEPKPDMKIAIPVKIMSRMPINKDRMPNLGAADNMRIALPNLEPAIRLLGLSDDFHHSSDFASLQAAIGNIPLNMRRMAPPDGDKQDGIRSVNPIAVPKMRSKRESERRFVLKQYKPSGSSLSVNFKETEPKTGESRYIPFNERSFSSEETDDNDSDDSEDEENIRPLFNFDDLENRFPSVLSSSRDNKRNDESYSTDESRNKQKYGILGSGNFEIIRGGIYADDESATNAVPNYVNENENSNNYENNDNNENRKSDQQRESGHPPHHNYDSNPLNSEQNSEEDNEPNRFSPFNLDFFTGTPVLGFQGYDNFDASSVEKFKSPSPPPPPPSRSSKVNGQRRQFYDPFSADSNLHIIATDEDLYSDS